MSDVFVDSSSNALTITNNGGVVYDTSAPAIGSGDANLSTGLLSTPMVSAIDLSAGDFTVEFWFLNIVPYDPTLSTILSQIGDPDFGSGLIISPYVISSQPIMYATLLQTGGTPLVINSNPGNIDTTVWNHLAIVLQGSTLSLYINGNLEATQSLSASVEGPLTGGFGIGGAWNSGFALTGNIDELRISNIARYTGNFTPASAPFTPDANTGMLLHFDPSGMPVPNVLGLTLSAATAALAADPGGFTVGTVTNTDGFPVGIIVAQSTYSAAPGSAIDLTMNAGPIQLGAKFVSPMVSKAIMLANPGMINPRVYLPETDTTARVPQPRLPL